MANLFNVAAMGLEHFHPNYGKLIGTGKKSGVQVYEALVGRNRVLSSVKDGKLFKQVTRTTNYSHNKTGPLAGMKVTTTEAKNFITGDTFKSVRGTKSSKREGYENIYRYFERQNAGTGNWESFKTEFIRKNGEKGVDPLNRADAKVEYINSDVVNGQVVEYSNYDWSGLAPLLKVGRKIPYKSDVIDYNLVNGLKIPKGTHVADVKTYNLKNPQRLMYSGGDFGTVSMEKNLGTQVFNYFDKLIQKLSGVKPKA